MPRGVRALGFSCLSVCLSVVSRVFFCKRYGLVGLVVVVCEAIASDVVRRRAGASSIA